MQIPELTDDVVKLFSKISSISVQMTARTAGKRLLLGNLAEIGYVAEELVAKLWGS